MSKIKLLSLLSAAALAVLLSSSVAMACLYCTEEDHPMVTLAPPDAMQVDQIIGQLAAPGQEQRVAALVEAYLATHVGHGYPPEQSVQHLVQLTQ